MKPLSLAGLAGLAAVGVHAQSFPPYPATSEPVVVTATRSIEPTQTLRDVIVITRDDLDAEGDLSLGEVLQRRAGIELRATGGAGQPQGLFIRGASPAQTLVLVDGLRVGSATVGTTSIENIPLELIERIEVVKGPLSSLYGSEAMGGVVQIFTRGKTVPHLFVSSAYGTDRDRRLAAGFTTVDENSSAAVSVGARRIDAQSATNDRSPLFVPDRDPHENAFANLRVTHRMWQGEELALDAFGSRSRTRFDAGLPPDGIPVDDRNDQTISGVRFTSSTHFAPAWASRISVGEGRDKIVTSGQFPGRFETRQDQASWVNEFTGVDGTLLGGLETVRQKVSADPTTDAAGNPQPTFIQDHRNTNSAFVEVRQTVAGQRVEASARHDDDEQFGRRTTGSLSYGVDWPSFARLAATYGRGFRAPTFFDLYATPSPYYVANPSLRPERNRSYEVSLRSLGTAAVQWSVTAFDNRIDNLVVLRFPPDVPVTTVENVGHARIRGVEAALDARWFGWRWHGALTAQRPRDEDTGERLPARAQRFGTLEASRSFGAWTTSVSVLASGDRFDASGPRLSGYAVVDARVRYAFDKRWSADLAATNLGDRRYETAFGYDAPHRQVLLTVRFEAY